MTTISKRIRNEVTDLEHQIWRALRESGSAILPYLSSDCIMLLHDRKLLDPSSLKQYLTSEFKPWAFYEMHDLKVVEVDMMAAVLCYKVTALKEGKGERMYEGVASSVWKQIASGDWKLCVHHQTLA